MEDLEVGHLRRVSRLDEGLEAALDELGLAAAQDGLLPEQVGEGLVVEGALEHTSAGGAQPLGEAEGDVLGVPGDVLVDADEGGDPESLGEDEPLHVAGGLGGHHDYVHAAGRDYELVGYREAVGELQGGPLLEVGLHQFLVDLGLDLVRQEHHDDVGLPDRVGDLGYLKAVLLRLLPGFPVLPDADDDVDPGIMEAEGLRPSLGAVSEDRNDLPVEDLQVSVPVVVYLHDNRLWTRKMLSHT